jgi:AcrR family transcriptional regulator
VTTRAERAAQTREQLVEAGLRLAENTSLGAMSVNLLVEEAGVAKGTFFHHFGDRGAFLVALHRAFHDRLFAQTLAAIAGLPPGRRRLLAAAHAYLDGCLRHRGVRALLLEARAEPAITVAIAERNALAVELQSPDFHTLGWPDPSAGAALWSGMVVEAALLELAAGERQDRLREALERFLPDESTS